MQNLDPETIHGDYAEAYQVWHHRFNKDGQKTEECFKDCAFVPFEPLFEPCETPHWDRFASSLMKEIERLKELGE